MVTTGTFDGVHIGHAQILSRINEVATQIGGESVLFSFYPHPRMVLYPDDHGLRLLHTQDEKHEALAAAGVDHLIEIPFTKQFASQPAKTYVQNVLVNTIGVHTMVIGYDHRFGKSREGDINTLKVLGPELGFAVEEIPAHMIDELKVSSTKVRNALLAGAVDTAAAALGRPYQMKGTVVAGDRIGREIGFPTANLEVKDNFKLIPANGVYAVQVAIDGVMQKGMMNIGYRPTLSSTTPVRKIEVHLLELEQDLYGKQLRVDFVRLIRQEVRFDSLNALKEQLTKDRTAVLQMMS